MLELERQAAFVKDAANEAALTALHTQLAPLHAELVAHYAHATPPLVFVIGMARSGTTLASQLCAASGFASVSNFVARFWQVPTAGALIEKLVLKPVVAMTSSFRSEHGVTEGWAEPHEFGYFWDRWFDLGQDSHQLDAAALARVDARALQRELAAIQAIAGRPLVCKNNTWCSLQAGFLAQLFPGAVFVVCRREPKWIAQSLLQGRITRYGSREAWWSIRPASYPRLKTQPWPAQIAGQIADFEKAMDSELKRVNPSRIVEAPYVEVCRDPAQVISRVFDALRATGSDFIADLARLPQGFTSTDRQQISDDDWRALNDALNCLLPTI